MATAVITKEKLNYHRLVELHIDCTIFVLRKYLEWDLRKNNLTLQTFLQQQHVKKWINPSKLYYEQIPVLSNPNVTYDMLDVVLATRLILEATRLIPERTPQDANILKAVKILRKSRNSISHTTDGRIQGTAQFNEACYAIQKVAAVLSKEVKNAITIRISDIQKREIVRTCSNMEKIMLSGEYFMIKLVEAGEDDLESQDCRSTQIKFNLTKWRRHLCRMPNVSAFLKTLKDVQVINEDALEDIEQEYSYGSQMEKLILLLQQSKEISSLYQFCKKLRKTHAYLADLIENRNTEGRDTDDFLQNVEREEISRFLHDKMIENPNGHIRCEDVHIAVEDELHRRVEFTIVKTCFLQVFHTSVFVEGDTSFRDVAWRLTEHSHQKKSGGQEMMHFGTMDLREFASYVGITMGEIIADFKGIFQTAILQEAIMPYRFEEMDDDQLKKVFTEYLGNFKYGIGIMLSLKKIQQQIRGTKPKLAFDTNKRKQKLREFDSPFNSQITYSHGSEVKVETGNLVVPAHEFRYSDSCNKHWIAKECTRFVAACMNSRKNGTIHFGIRLEGDRSGTILGIAMLKLKNLEEEILDCMKICFAHEHLQLTLSCTRPLQEILIKDSETVVYELDVVASAVYSVEDLMSIKFPPKGPQNDEIFVYDSCVITTISEALSPDVQHVYKKRLQERRTLESRTSVFLTELCELRTSLVSTLTGKGSKYVTDEYVPIIVTGNIENNCDIRNELSIDAAFVSSKFVLDFDASPEIRKAVEKDRSIFTVKTPEDISEKSPLENYNTPVWVYCNGNSEIMQPRMTLQSWTNVRYDAVRCCMDTIRKSIPKGRARVIFLLYGELTDQDPLFDIAKEMMTSLFRGECVVLSQNANNCKMLRNDMARRFGDMEVDKFILTGQDWKFLSDVLRSGFRPNSNVVCKLPSSSTELVAEMTNKERTDLNITDIEIVSGEECELEAENMTKQKLREKEQEVQTLFYKGGGVSWWNFYFKTHICKRNCFRYHLDEIKQKLKKSAKGDHILEIYEIKHHPGSGGSTLGRHILWTLSQFKGVPHNAYRCCVVKHITETTVDQIGRVRDFKDIEDAKPIILLVDNKSEDSVMLLRSKLQELAYKTGTPDTLYGLIIVLNRSPISKGKWNQNVERIITHELKGKELYWFHKKYEELEHTADIDVKTLIAFNVMRHSFDQKYIDKITAEILKDVTELEKVVLKTLALVSSYKTYKNDHAIHQSVFDNIMSEQQDLESLTKLPFGIAHTRQELESLAKDNTVWNMKVSSAMHLLITKRETENYIKGIAIISQPLARAIITSLMNEHKISLKCITDSVLDLVSQHTNAVNPMSKLFIKTVCRLFKTRQFEEMENRETRLKFSDLVLDLEKNDKTKQHVILTMSRCFDITKDAMVGQQLARYNIFIHEFNAAQNAIEKSLEIKPINSYLLDTYGQIFKAQMEKVFESWETNHYEKATEVIELAFLAVEKFKDGQKAAIEMEDDTNMSCFHMEVKTALYLLEHFRLIEGFDNTIELCKFLLHKETSIKESPYFKLLQMCPKLEHLRFGSDWQQHLEQSLRTLEEQNYQIKRYLYTVQHDDDSLLLNLRDRYERFYGGNIENFRFSFGLGLKPLMNAMQSDTHRTALDKRVEEAKQTLSRGFDKKPDIRDLLVFLGVRIITLCNRFRNTKRSPCSSDEYISLLKYSTKLLILQREKYMPRKYLEAYLYYAMLHWPLPGRTQFKLEDLASGGSYEEVMKEWEEQYDKNHYIYTKEQSILKKPKNYYALGKGSAGNDIVDLESIKREWMERKKTDGRTRKPVFKDFFWREPFVEDELQRLDGVVAGNGHLISHSVQYSNNRRHTFKIKTYYPCEELSNRPITFVLGFTWKGPTAFDVREQDRIPRQPSNAAIETVDYREHLTKAAAQVADGAAAILKKATVASSTTVRITDEAKPSGPIPRQPSHAASEKIDARDTSTRAVTQKTKGASAIFKTATVASAKIVRSTDETKQSDPFPRQTEHAVARTSFSGDNLSASDAQSVVVTSGKTQTHLQIVSNPCPRKRSHGAGEKIDARDNSSRKVAPKTEGAAVITETTTVASSTTVRRSDEIKSSDPIPRHKDHVPTETSFPGDNLSAADDQSVVVTSGKRKTRLQIVSNPILRQPSHAASEKIDARDPSARAVAPKTESASAIFETATVASATIVRSTDETKPSDLDLAAARTLFSGDNVSESDAQSVLVTSGKTQTHLQVVSNPIPRQSSHTAGEKIDARDNSPRAAAPKTEGAAAIIETTTVASSTTVRSSDETKPSASRNQKRKERRKIKKEMDKTK